MLENVNVYHSSIKIVKDVTIYFDPFKINEEYHDADIIFITHSHYDHYSKEDIDKIIKEGTAIVAPKSMLGEIEYENTIFVEPQKEYEAGNIKISTVWAYNVGKPFHPRHNMWVGYVVELDGEKIYVAGDTDITDEAKKVRCDIAFLPCGGIYTMNTKQASELANIIHPKIAVPTHYGAIVGDKKDGKEFISFLEDDIEGIELIK